MVVQSSPQSKNVIGLPESKFPVKVADIMTTDVVKMSRNRSIADAITLLAGTVCGIVTSTDIMKSYHNMLESIKA
jgi:predicted transcriptional regulator